MRVTRLLWLLAAAAGTVLAQVPAEPPAVFTRSIAQSFIGNAALSNMRGRAAVNISAGALNAQSNAAAIATSLGEVSAAAGVIQRIDARGSAQPEIATATIADRAFANAVGMVSVNQASGLGNAQANTVAIGLGFEPEVVAESALATATSGIGPAGRRPGDARRREAAIADTAFEGARGLVQVNQSAGSGNSTANNFALRVHTGARP